MKVKFSRVAVLLTVCVLLLALTPAAAAPAQPTAPTQGTWAAYTQAAPPIIPTGAAMNAISVASAIDAWAVGDPISMVPQAYHWNGATWSQINTSLISTGTVAFNSISFIPGAPNAAAVAVGIPEGGTCGVGVPCPSLVALCSVTACIRIRNVPTTGQLDSVWALSSSDIWAVGAGGIVLHWNGTAFENFTGQVPNTQYHGVQMLSANDGWAVGGRFGAAPGPGVLIHWNGTAWQEETLTPAPTMPLIAVSFSSPTEGYVVGGNPNVGAEPVVYHYSGGTWTEDAPTTLGSPTAFWSVSAGPAGVFAVGGGGQVFQRQGDKNWTVRYTDPSGQILYGVDISPDGKAGWAVGGSSQGLFVRYTGQVRDKLLYLPLVARN